jgi:subtilisin family serine protease
MNWAMRDCKVDIIVLPFGFDHVVYKVYVALKIAAYRGILVFSAASPLVSSGSQAYPPTDPHMWIGVASTDATGRVTSFDQTIPPNVDRFATLGAQVPSSWPGQGQSTPLSGTSVSSVIAAGVAASALAYARHLEPKDGPAQSSLKTREGKMALLRLLGQPSEHGTYLNPWVLFGQSDNPQPKDTVHGKIYDELEHP